MEATGRTSWYRVDAGPVSLHSAVLAAKNSLDQFRRRDSLGLINEPELPIPMGSTVHLFNSLLGNVGAMNYA